MKNHMHAVFLETALSLCLIQGCCFGTAGRPGTSAMIEAEYAEENKTVHERFYRNLSAGFAAEIDFLSAHGPANNFIGGNFIIHTLNADHDRGNQKAYRPYNASHADGKNRTTVSGIRRTGRLCGTGAGTDQELSFYRLKKGSKGCTIPENN